MTRTMRSHILEYCVISQTGETPVLVSLTLERDQYYGGLSPLGSVRA